ncbi:RNA-directed DNA polymerase from mobile element jockey [Holothuria leucospilota]|uniref:RNA-directed DNA polymerase from mobile element jockey n=1 Tax=Holothuria leucospilota TaxID=206669 RepID=A0A9Q1BJF7_HOLLE|nr:RNA-directed DNA polymerase from mobile element jockey [Holothuria leucospilota]
MKVMFANVRSLFNKFSEFLAHISIDNPDIVGVTETWLHSDISNSEIQVPGYKIFRQDRADTVCGRGGGVLLYVKNSINCVDVTNKFSSGFSNCLWCEISFGNESCTPLVVGIIYRSPNSCADNNQSLFESFRIVSSKRAVVFGDFNFPDIDWHSCTSGSHGRDFLEAVSDGFFTQHVLFPTREDNCLDLVLSTDENMVRNVASGGKIGSSDHDLISFELLCYSKLQGSDKTVLDFSKANFTHAKELLTIDWVAHLSHLGPAEAWSVFRNIVTDTTKLCIPLKKAVVKNRPIWMSREVLRAARKKRKCWRRYRVSKNSDDFAVYKKQELLVKNLVIDTKAKFEKQLAKEVKVNPKSFHAYVRSKQKVKEGVGPLQGNEGTLVTDHQDMANLLNDYFVSVFTKESSVLGTCRDSDNSSLVSDVVFSEELVCNKLKSLKASKAPGPDGIHPAILHECSEILSVPLCIIFQKFLDSNFVPADWRIANVTPIFKKGDRSLPCNYRPVSLTSVVCKVMESVIKDCLLKYLLDNGLLNLSQHGFLPSRSCVTNLLSFLEDVSLSLDCGHSVDVIYLDFSKAFDKVPLGRLMVKLHRLGIKGSCADWINSWLNGRSQRVVVNGNFSSWKEVTSGVPQGSVLGPLLFLIFINDIDSSLTSSISKFADDTKLYRKVSDKDDASLLQKDLDRLFSWSQTWQMSFNADKCKVLHFGPKNFSYDYNMNGSILSDVTFEKDLGVVITPRLGVPSMKRTSFF